MISIRKGKEPGSLAWHRATPHSTYGNLTTEAKQELREALVRDQRGLCCYGMGRIQPTETGMKIEHWFPQHPDRDDELHPENEGSAPARSAPQPQATTRRVGQESDLSYRNMLAACPGNQGRPSKEQHCDTRKGEKTITVDPRYPSTHPGLITYRADGTICLEGLQDDLDDRLGLNYQTRDSAGNIVDGYLKRNRKSRLANYQEQLRRRQPEGDWDFQGELVRLESLPEPPPQVGVILAWLRKKCRRRPG